MPTIRYLARSARLSVHKLFTSCIQWGLALRDSIVFAASGWVMSALSVMLSTRIGQLRKCGEFSCMECTGQGNGFEPTVEMETFIATLIYALCSNFVKFGQRKLVISCVAYLIKNFALPFSCRYCANRAQNLLRPVSNNVLRVLQISSKSVHFRSSYSSVHEPRHNVP